MADEIAALITGTHAARIAATVSRTHSDGTLSVGDRSSRCRV